MLKEQVFVILNEVLSKFNFKNDQISYKAIFDSDIHPAIKNYFKAELKILFSKDKALLKKKSVFNYSSNKLDYLFNQIYDELLKSTFINSEEFNNLLLQAISFNLSHLIKPNWSLKKLIFNDKKSINSNDFFYLLDYPYFFSYQKNIILKYFKKLDYNYIEVEKFDDVLKKIDIKLFKENKKELLIDFFQSALDFTDRAKNQILASDIVLTYLASKELNDEFIKIKNFIEKSNQVNLSISDFEEILFNATEAPNVISITEDDSLNSYSIDGDNEEDVDERKKSDLKKDLSTNLNKFKKEKNDDNLSLFDDEPEITFENESLSNHNDDVFSEDIITSENSYNDKSEVEKISASDFLQYLSEKEISRIQENLFNSDSEDFISFVEQLVSAKSFEDSLIKLNNLFNEFQIDQSSKEINLIKITLQKFYKG